MIKKILSPLVLFFSSTVLAGMVNLNLSSISSANLNEQFNVSLIAAGNETMMAGDIIIGWNPNDLQLIGYSHQNSHPLIWQSESGIKYPDFYGINESAIPSDGTAVYTGYVNLGQSINSSNPFEIVSFIFKPINITQNTSIQILPNLNINFPCETAIYGSNGAGINVLGSIQGCNISIIPAPSAALLICAFGILPNRRRRR